MVMRWLITGGCGFIGVNLIDWIKQNNPNDKIIVVDNLSVGKREDLSNVIDFQEVECYRQLDEGFLCALIVKDITTQIMVQDFEGFDIDIVVHLAANTGVQPSIEDPHFDCHQNVIGTLNMLEIARSMNVGKFIFASSAGVVGPVEPPLHEKVVPMPMSPYGASKLSGEAYCAAYNNTFGLHTVALRFGNVYGPKSSHKGSVVAKFIKKIIEGSELSIYGDGQQTRDFIFIDDLIGAIISATQIRFSKYEVFQIATSQETTVLELIDILQTVFQEDRLKVNYKFINPLKGDVRRNFSDTTKAKRMLNWSASISLQEGIKKTIKWFLEEGNGTITASSKL